MIHIPVSPGELLDKISIMQIKERHIKDPLKLKNIVHELSLLQEIRDNSIKTTPRGWKAFTAASKQLTRPFGISRTLSGPMKKKKILVLTSSNPLVPCIIKMTSGRH